MLMDMLTLGAGVFSFGIFLLIHVIAFRWIAPERLLKSLVFIMVLVMALPAVLIGMVFFLKFVNAPAQEGVCAALLAMLVCGLCCSVYVLCIFGPYETSVRMRLIRELAQGHDKGISLQELSGRYNAETIVKIRLQRLIGSGDIIEKDGRYRCVSNGNLFFVFDAIAGILKKCIGSS